MSEPPLQRIRVVDSHTAGEPTRVVVAGGPHLGRGSLAERRQRFGDEFGAFRSAIVNEPRVDSRNFVLCAGKADDRSPCGTGTSAKLACLAADHQLQEGQVWRQESIIGSVFEGTFRWGQADAILPRITGSAYVCAEATLVLDPNDPFQMGIRA